MHHLIIWTTSEPDFRLKNTNFFSDIYFLQATEIIPFINLDLSAIREIKFDAYFYTSHRVKKMIENHDELHRLVKKIPQQYFLERHSLELLDRIKMDFQSKKGNILWLRGKRVAHELKGMWNEKNVGFYEIQLYDTVMKTPSQDFFEKIKNYDSYSVVFSSPSAVENFPLTLYNAQYFAIGDTTAMAILDKFQKEPKVPRVSSFDALAELVRSHGK